MLHCIHHLLIISLDKPATREGDRPAALHSSSSIIITRSVSVSRLVPWCGSAEMQRTSGLDGRLAGVAMGQAVGRWCCAFITISHIVHSYTIDYRGNRWFFCRRPIRLPTYRRGDHQSSPLTRANANGSAPRRHDAQRLAERPTSTGRQVNLARGDQGLDAGS